MRIDGREYDQLRPIEVNLGYLKYAEGSCLIKAGDTVVLCATTIQKGVPHFLTGTGQAWITAEYSLLPRSTRERTIRESVRGRIDGRTHEIRRMIGRSLRSVIALEELGEITFIVDCDVIQADGGTRTLSITGGFLSLVQAIKRMVRSRELTTNPIREFLAGVSVGVVGGIPRLDLCYEEDVNAEVDMNVVLTESGKIVEIQGTAEAYPFERSVFDQLFNLARKGIEEIIRIEHDALQGI
ncbi:ribonuclease PH [candidate division WOR-3 bacterium]|uniref:Ribonuclease PH n=1 Tax=candidate division WOR-3 bacterium TaxID=2052148 RepID=A0A660SJF8_UNCW3|nr:MAG: ribonuclease PH [candidate division WOR-3 bacterium]